MGHAWANRITCQWRELGLSRKARAVVVVYMSTQCMRLTSINIDMTDQQPQWGCPYCSQVFPLKDHLKEHLELDKVCVQLYYCFSTYFGQQIIFHLFSQLQQALLPNCHQYQDAASGSIASEGEIDDANSTKRSRAEKPLRCPHPDCQTKQTYSKKAHLTRHFKMRMLLK
ncbi:hypothetical protein BGZ60DRAFT_270696 [Tricladium varicosporioides]|nr:hypothetical protein BGZ60DRAFT_270696 [Hymenoscyphus varicosporioides]